jgi:2-dehydro-3-deoxyphosphogluconate aldolase/(4S)-4-hydroxy-2-oxoglutarate aldolase
MSPLEQILHYKIVAILRGVPPADVLHVANALYAGGIRVLELTLNSDDAFAQIEQLSNKMQGKMLIGAGTVLDVEGAKKAISAGAKFLIAPNVDIDVIRCAKDHDLVSIPGAYTATEVSLAYKSGGDIIKVFPVSAPAYLKSLLAPLNHIKMMPTGGVDLTNIRQFRDAGAVAFGIGSSLVNKVSAIDDAYLTGLTEKAGSLVQAISGHK